MGSGKTTETRDCPYCFEQIPEEATRCKHCAGKLWPCPKCLDNVGVVTKQKFVGLLRGGTKEQRRCMDCGTVVDGPRW